MRTISDILIDVWRDGLQAGEAGFEWEDFVMSPTAKLLPKLPMLLQTEDGAWVWVFESLALLGDSTHKLIVLDDDHYVMGVTHDKTKAPSLEEIEQEVSEVRMQRKGGKVYDLSPTDVQFN